MKYQVCFQIKDKEHNSRVKEKLKALANTLQEGDEVLSCHLPKYIVEEKGFDTEMCEALEEIFGNKYKCMVTGETFETAIKEMNTYRSNTAKLVDKIVIIEEQSISNIALEIELFTNNKIEFI